MSPLGSSSAAAAATAVVTATAAIAAISVRDVTRRPVDRDRRIGRRPNAKASRNAKPLEGAGRAHRFEALLQIEEEPARDGAVDDAMVEREADVHHRTDGDRVVVAHDG